MDLTSLPFNAHVGILPATSDDHLLRLPGAPHLLNHLGTVHASALFSLAEASSGEFLNRQVAATGRQDIGAVVRKAECKYSSPASGELTSASPTEPDALQEAIRSLEDGKRTLFTIDIDLHDTSGTRIARFSFTWFLFVVAS